MKSLIKLVVTNLLVISAGWAASFQAVSLEKLLNSSDVIVVGDFLRSKSVIMEDGLVATEALFKVEKESGLDAEDFGLSEIKVYYPGGVGANVGTRVEGAPEFVAGEKNIVLLKQHDDGRLWVQSMALGTFKLVKIGTKTLAVNSVFPHHSELSNLEFHQFQKTVNKLKSKPLKDVLSDKYFSELKKSQSRHYSSSSTVSGNSRAIASKPVLSDNNQESQTLGHVWLLGILALMGVLGKWWSSRSLR
jgi:hypothetical protein